ncbi:unnamed protein product [Mytilus coruscus]|uniref:Reverse transcriptase/retrotransposon-derived protein RNase H-like domain-containing protein n=1 Tax=Mytilus coruscus TaxID=42192 RepID=A0A6J8A9H7_MYTCO|nr:unnamed protein product [Mytilus coruscus]
MKDRLSAMLTDKLNSSVAEMSAIQAHNTNQSNEPYQRQRYQQRPKSNFQQQNYQRPPISTCQGCGKPNLKKTHVYSVLGTGQQKLRVLGKVFLTIQIKEKCFDFDFHVIDTLPHSLIIGVDFLETNNVTINLSRKSMEISDKCAKICSLETNSGLARCIKSCALPANSEIVLPVHVSRRIQGEQVLLEPNPNLEKKQLMGARCIVTVNKGKSVFRIINPTNKTVHLPRRYVLANAINVDEQFMQTLDNAKVKSMNTIETKPKNTDNLEFDLSKAELTSQQKSQLRTFLNENKNQLFNCLSKANLTLKPSKCSFAVTEVEYLGHVISKEGVKVDPEKTSAVATFPEPKTQKDVRSFLGMCNYYRQFVQSYSKITTPLTELLKKNVQFRWTAQCQIAFDDLKTRLTSSPILAYADMNKPFEVKCDASDYAIGHVNTKRRPKQIKSNSIRRTIARCS